MKIGEYIKAYRAEHSMSMEDFAKRANMSKAYVSMLERDVNSKTGKPIEPSMSTFNSVAAATNMDLQTLLEKLDGDQIINLCEPKRVSNQTVRIPLLGRIVAGTPVEANQEVLGYEEIPAKQARTGDYFALRVKGASMSPKIEEGDTVIVRKQDFAEEGDISIVLVNGCDATVKLIQKTETGLMLIGYNSSVYAPHFYSEQEIHSLPVQIIGKVVEMRRKL